MSDGLTVYELEKAFNRIGWIWGKSVKDTFAAEQHAFLPSDPYALAWQVYNTVIQIRREAEQAKAEAPWYCWPSKEPFTPTYLSEKDIEAETHIIRSNN